MEKHWVWVVIGVLSIGMHADANSFANHGVSIDNQPSMTISGGTFRGGDGATVSNPTNTTYANAGNGIDINNTSSITITGGMMLGGNGGIATATEGAYATGGHGLYLANAPSVTINDGTMVGGDGGVASATISADASGGHGLVLTNTTTTIFNGVFEGGISGNATANHTRLRIGSSLFADSSSVILKGGTFADGVTLQGVSSLTVQEGVSMGALIINGNVILHQLDAPCAEIRLNAGTLTTDSLSSSTHWIFHDGRLILSGDFAATNGLSVAFPNTSPTTNAITVSGTVTLAGPLSINLNPESLRIGEQLCLLDCASVTGRFSNTEDTLESNHCNYRIIHTGRRVLIEKTDELQTARGTPHWWLTKYGLTNSLFEAEDAGDHDHDGLTAREEYIAGTDPTSATSSLSAALDVTGPETLEFAWSSERNVVYQLLCRTNLLQSQSVILKEDIFATPPTNRVTLHAGGVTTAFLEIEAQARVLNSKDYTLLSPASPTFVGTFCVTNAVQFEAVKEELGLAGQDFDFSSEVVIGTMAPLTSSITGRYQMKSVFETSDAILVCYQYFSYYPNSMPAFNKDVMVVRTEHRNKPVRLVFLGTTFSGNPPVWLNPIIPIDPANLPPLFW